MAGVRRQEGGMSPSGGDGPLGEGEVPLVEGNVPA